MFVDSRKVSTTQTVIKASPHSVNVDVSSEYQCHSILGVPGAGDTTTGAREDDAVVDVEQLSLTARSARSTMGSRDVPR